MNTDELLKMIEDAVDGMKSENMYCPWCTGHLRHGEDEEHDQFCDYLKLHPQDYFGSEDEYGNTWYRPK